MNPQQNEGTDDKRSFAAYLRVSTADQKTGLASQMMAVKNYFERNSITNFRIYQDENVSGAKASRPALDEMLKEMEAGGIKSIVAFSFSRISRSCSHLLKLLELCDHHDCQLVSITEAIDSKTHMGRLMTTLIGALAEMERAILRERVMAGLNRVRAEGKILGRKPTRPSKLIRQLFKKGLTYQESARIANTSQGSVGKEVFKMKEELAKERGLDLSEAKNISTIDLRKHFQKEDNSLELSEPAKKSTRLPLTVELPSAITPEKGEFDFIISNDELLELESI